MERPKVKTSRFGARKDLFIKKAPTKKMEALLHKSPLPKYRAHASFMSREGDMEGQEVVDPTDIKVPAGV